MIHSDTNPVPEKPKHPKFAMIKYLIENELKATEIGTGRVRAKLIGDTGIGSRTRFLDGPIFGSDPDAWRRNESKPGEPLKPLEPTKEELFDAQQENSEGAQRSKKIEKKAAEQSGNIEDFLKAVDKSLGKSGAFVFPGFNLSKEAQTPGKEQLAKDVAEVMAAFVVEENSNFFSKYGVGDEKGREAAAEIIIQKILTLPGLS